MATKKTNVETRSIRGIFRKEGFGVLTEERGTTPARDGRVDVGARSLDGHCILGGIGVVPGFGAMHSHAGSLGEVPATPEHRSLGLQRS
ncbi:unannotated protein [freshwater metagenome]|uniref:Unannotated protein n=1 Tax=freshwater metagenome TaxID=449393 RepID=A0A6J6YUC6_9ZZZZ